MIIISQKRSSLALVAVTFCFLFIYAFPLYAAGGIHKVAALTPELAPGFKPDKSNFEAGLWMIMDKAETAIKESPNRVKNEKLEAYLHSIICKLTPDYCSDIRVYVTRVPYFNASMAPNGMMVIWTGLLLRTENEAQLATILGHEIGHYLRRHSMKQFKNARIMTSFATFITIGLGFGDSGQYIDLANIVTLGSIFAHSRSSEEEADRYAIQLIKNAGYDPFEAAKIWKNIIDEEAAATFKKNHGIPFLATHPSSKNRLETLTEMAQQMTAGGTETGIIGTEKYQSIVDGLLKQNINDELLLHQFGRAEYLLNKLLIQNYHVPLIHYYIGELYRQRNNDGDIGIAKKHYLLSIESNSPPVDAYRSLGLIEYKAGDFSLAKSNFTKYLELAPHANDREMIEFYLSSGDQ